MGFSPGGACFPQFNADFSTAAAADGRTTAWVLVVLWEIRFPVDTPRLSRLGR
jgi:hypothetical protein